MRTVKATSTASRGTRCTRSTSPRTADLPSPTSAARSRRPPPQSRSRRSPGRSRCSTSGRLAPRQRRTPSTSCTPSPSTSGTAALGRRRVARWWPVSHRQMCSKPHLSPSCPPRSSLTGARPTPTAAATCCGWRSSRAPTTRSGATASPTPSSWMATAAPAPSSTAAPIAPSSCSTVLWHPPTPSTALRQTSSLAALPSESPSAPSLITCWL